MSEEEIALSKSTPAARFDAPPPKPAPDVEEAPPVVTAKAEAFVEEVISSPQQPVVMFALEWCEFCWSVRKMFDKVGIAYRSVDLDSAENQADGWGGQVRAAITAKTHMPTIPQIFVGGEFIGGCTETFDAFNDGRLQGLLSRFGVEAPDPSSMDAYDFLPKWLHPR
jgi:cysteine synthase A